MVKGKMMPIGPLMIEHRLIERMLEVMKRELEAIKASSQVDHDLIAQMVDFIRMYADRCHHGKEEGILFREAGKKDLSAEHQTILKELVDEHAWARGVTGMLVGANEKHRQGDREAWRSSSTPWKNWCRFIRSISRKKTGVFFLPLMAYFSNEEKDTLLEEEYTFDRGLIHEKYEMIVKKNEEKYGL